MNLDRFDEVLNRDDGGVVEADTIMVSYPLELEMECGFKSHEDFFRGFALDCKLAKFLFESCHITFLLSGKIPELVHMSSIDSAKRC